MDDVYLLTADATFATAEKLLVANLERAKCASRHDKCANFKSNNEQMQI